MIEFLKKHKERVSLLGVVLAFLLFFIGGGTYIQKHNKRAKEPSISAFPISVELKPQQTAKGQTVTEPTAASTTYFLKPSPDELLEQLASMENLNEDIIDKKFLKLSVLWPAYFFSLRTTDEGRKTLLLDVSEDGFGVIIQTEVDLQRYPKLKELASGEKIWIGGQILAVDPAGTGTIYLKTEQLSVGSEAPLSVSSALPRKTEKSKSTK